MIDIEAVLLHPSGRIGRQTYWTLSIVLLCIAFLLSFIPFFGALATLPLLWPLGCVLAQRLHDSDRRAWPVIVVALLSLIAAILSFAVTMMATEPASIVAAFGFAVPVMILSGMSTMATLGLILFAGMSRPSAGQNRFGAPEPYPVTFATLLPREPN